MIRRCLIASVLFLAVGAAAAVIEVQLAYKDVTLKDGTILGDVTLKSFNTTAGTALLLVNKEMKSVPLSLLPDEVTAKLKELTPVLTKAEQDAEKIREAADRAEAQATAERRQREAEEEARAARAASLQSNVKSSPVRSQAETDRFVAEVARVAEARARSYFMYQDDPWSNIGAVLGSDIIMHRPETVPGWTGRYRVTGTVFRQFVNNQASGYGRGSKEFEVLVDTTDYGAPQVVDIQMK
jgi:hypothetical protein